MALSVFDASSTFLSYSYGPAPISFRLALLYSTTNWYIWALLAVPTALIASRFSFERGRRLRAVVVLGLTGAVIAWARIWLYGAITEYLYATPPNPMQVRLIRQWPASFLTYIVLLIACFAVRYYRLYRERELRASQLESAFAQARLDALRSQLHPHFLFNTLNSISTLMHRDVAAADDMLSALSDLLRVALDRGGEQEVTLKEELDFLQRYLEIEQIRFGDRLRIELDIEPRCLDALLPNLLLQPLAENAIRHGIDPLTQGGQVRVRAGCRNDLLVLSVQDDGQGVPDVSAIRYGVGLGNTSDRLRQLYGDGHQMVIASSNGFTVTVTIPLKLR